MANLPHDIVLAIIVRLPVKSVLRFRCVSKAWCKLSKDPKFVKKHLNHAIERNKFSLMMLSFSSPFSYDEDTHTYTLAYDPALSTLSDPVYINYPSRDNVMGIQVWGTCNGLICVTSVETWDILIWNPATKEFKELPDLPFESAGGVCTYEEHAFGYDEQTDDYKVLSLRGFEDGSPEVSIYTLKSNSWRRIHQNEYWVPFDGHELQMAQVIVNGATHWISTNFDVDKVIASFDFKDEKFDEMPLPKFSYEYPEELKLCSLGGSLCLCGYVGSRTDVWEMKEYGVTDSWTKLFTINRDAISDLVPLQFVRNGEVLLGYDTDVGYRLDLCHIKLNTSTNLKAYAKQDGNYATAFVYVESLVTLGSGTYVGLPEVEDLEGVIIRRPRNNGEEIQEVGSSRALEYGVRWQFNLVYEGF